MQITMSGFIAKNRHPILDGTRAFAAVWLGQVISFIGSGLTSFALGVWVLEKTCEITQYALISMFFVLPGVLRGPPAGMLVDRWNRVSAIRQTTFLAPLAAEKMNSGGMAGLPSGAR